MAAPVTTRRIGALSRRPVQTSVAASPHAAMTKKRKHRKPRIFTHVHRQRLERAVSHYLDECYANTTAARASEFAAFLRRHPAYLSRTVVAIVGMTLRAYLRSKQLEEAERLLVTTPLPIAEIALHAGFGTTSTFYRCFKKARGLTPAAFREVKK